MRRLWKGLRLRVRARRPDVSLAEGWRISFGRVFRRNGTAKENERFSVSSLTDGLKRVAITDVERVDLWLVGMEESPKIERAVVL